MENNPKDDNMIPSVPLVLPGIEEMIKTPLPETCESSATTVPPAFIPSNEATSHTPLEIPPVSLLSSLPAIPENPFSHNNASMKPAPAQTPPRNLTQDHNASEKGSPVKTTKSLPTQTLQKRKRRAPQQPRKRKQARSNSGQVSQKQRGRPKGRKKQNAKEKQVTVSTKAFEQNDLSQDRENVNTTQQNAGNCVNKDVSRGNEASNDDVVSQEKNIICNSTQKISGQQGNCSQPSTAHMERSSVQSCEKASIKKREGSKLCKEVAIPAQRGEQRTVHEDDGKRKEAGEASTVTDSAEDDSGSGDRPDPTSEEAKMDNKMTAGKQDEVSLEEKYADLSKRYMSLIGGMLQSSKLKSHEDSDIENEGRKNDGSLIVDRKVYDTIYLCKTAQMLGALNIDGGPLTYVRPRIEGFDNPYKRIMMDGFEFVEELMIMGQPEDSLKSVSTVFRDLHIRLLTDVWKKHYVGDGGRLVGVILKVMAEQLKNWYAMIIDSKIGIRWCAIITEEFLEALSKKLSNMGEKHTTTVVKMLREVLKEISEFYQEAEKDVSKACLDKFSNSCEVSVCIATTVPDAVLSLDVEDIFVIGRHNGVFAHCVARLQAERDAEEGD